MVQFKKIISGASADSIALLMVKLVTMVLGMVTARILSEVLSFTQYGTYSQVMLLQSSLVSLTIFGMIDGCNFFFYNNKGLEERQQYLSTIITIQYLIGIICALLLLILMEPISSYFKNADLKGLLLFAAFLSMTKNIISILHVLFVAVGKAKLIAVRNLVVSVAKLSLFAFSCWILRSVGAVLAFSLALNILEILYLRYGLKRNNCTLSIKDTNFKLLRSIVSYCLPMAAFIVLSNLSRDCDRYVVSAFTDTDTLAVYTNASAMLPFDLITISFGTVLIPYLTRYIAEKNYTQARELYGVFLHLCLIATTILAASALVGAPMFMRLLYSEKYLSGLPIFMVYILVDIFRTLNITLVMSAAGKGRQLLMISAISLCSNLFLNVLFYHWLGILGPAISTLVVTIMTGILIQKKCARILQCKLSQLFDWKYTGIFVIQLVCCAALFLWISRQLNLIGMHYFLRLVIVSGGMAITLVLANAKRILSCVRKIGKY